MADLGQVIQRVNKIKPNRYGDQILAAWLSDLDGRCALETMGLEEAPAYAWPGDEGTQLLIPPPFDRVYELYLTAMIDFHNREMDSYQNDMEAFNSAMGEWMAWYRRMNPTPPARYTGVF